MGTIISATLLLYPKKYFFYNAGKPMIWDDSVKDIAKPILQWGYILPITITVLIIGGLLIYTLRDKKK